MAPNPAQTVRTRGGILALLLCYVLLLLHPFLAHEEFSAVQQATGSGIALATGTSGVILPHQASPASSTDCPVCRQLAANPASGPAMLPTDHFNAVFSSVLPLVAVTQARLLRSRGSPRAPPAAVSLFA